MNRADYLVTAYLDDGLTEAEEAELNAWLMADGENVRTFVEANVREQQLRSVVRARGDLRLLVATSLEVPTQIQTFRRRSTIRLVTILAAAAAIVIISAQLLWQRPALHEARLGGDVAGVKVERDGTMLDAVVGMRLSTGDVVRTHRGGTRIEIVDEDTRFTFAARSSVALRELRGQKRFELLTGSVSADVAKQSAGALIWRTDDAEAQVLGTKFELSADGLLTRLDVSEGAVQFQGRHTTESTVVHAGQFAATDSQSLILPREAEQWLVSTRRTTGCEHVSFHSRQIEEDIGVNVLLPPQYASEPGRRFPVLYFLQGLAGNEHTEAARFTRLFTEAMKRGELPPFIAVFPNGGPGYTPRPMSAGLIFAQELPRFIDSRYRTRPERSSRMICGIGFGGKRAVLYATLDAHVFGAGCAIDDTFHGGTPSFFNLIDALQPRISRNPPRLLVLHGQPWATEKVDKLATTLRAKKIEVETRALPAQPQSSTGYMPAVAAELGTWISQQWSTR